MDDTEKAPKKAVIYARYSESGTNKDTSIETQLRECKKACAFRGWEVAKIYKDKGKSATTEANRPGFERACHEVCTGPLRGAGVLVAYDLSRFARNTLNALKLFRRLKDADADMYLVSGSCRVDTTDPQWELFWTMLAGMYSFQAAEIRKKTKAGVANRRAKGLQVGRDAFGKSGGERAELEWFMWRRANGWKAGPLSAELHFRGIKHACRDGRLVYWTYSAAANVYNRNKASDWEKHIERWRELPPDGQPKLDEYDIYINRCLKRVKDMHKRTHPKKGAFIVPRAAAHLVLDPRGYLAVDPPVASKLIHAAMPKDIPLEWKKKACKDLPVSGFMRVDNPRKVVETE